jgi:hypothetical protein
LRIDIPWLHLKGHLWSSLFDLGQMGAMLEAFAGYAIVFAGEILIAESRRTFYKSQ